MMSKLRAFFSGKLKWLIPLVAVLAIGGFFVFRHMKAKKSAVPEGIASGNGRISAKEIDVASKLPLKVAEVYVEEGDMVDQGDILVKMDTTTLEAELAEANESAATAREQVAVAKAAIARSSSQIELARIERARAQNLVEERAGSQRELDVRNMALKSSRATMAEEVARLDVAKQQIKAAEANVLTIQTRIDDATLRAPVSGRVLYRLAEPGEVLAAGGKALTLIDLQDVYMEIFLPSEQAAAIEIGSEARFTVDHLPKRVGVGYVSFVSPEAQFTPKEVETRSEREKLMFRVKIQIPEELLRESTERIKTGVRGVGYVRLNESVEWPKWLMEDVIIPPSGGEQALR
jgi:HlyD family secretion protein